jgi:tetratricopeptide (TPR) repeat protein
MNSKTLIIFGLLISLFNCNPARHEIPITTSSDEARELFVKGRDMWECREQDKANEFLRKAVELDPDFALAYVYYEMPAWAFKAGQLMDKVTPGEKLFIKGGLAYVSGDFQQAEIHYDSLVQMYPKDKHCICQEGIHI